MSSLPPFAYNLFALHSVNAKITVQKKNAESNKHQLSVKKDYFVYYEDKEDNTISVTDWPETVYRIPSNSVAQFFRNIDKELNFKTALVTSKSQSKDLTNSQKTFKIADLKQSNNTPPKSKESSNHITRKMVDSMINRKPSVSMPTSKPGTGNGAADSILNNMNPQNKDDDGNLISV